MGGQENHEVRAKASIEVKAAVVRMFAPGQKWGDSYVGSAVFVAHEHGFCEVEAFTIDHKAAEKHGMIDPATGQVAIRHLHAWYLDLLRWAHAHGFHTMRSSRPRAGKSRERDRPWNIRRWLKRMGEVEPDICEAIATANEDFCNNNERCKGT